MGRLGRRFDRTVPAARPSTLRCSSVLLALRFLALPLHAGLLVVLATASLSEDARLLDLLVEAAQGALERLVLAHSDFCQSGFTSSGRSSRARDPVRNPANRERVLGGTPRLQRACRQGRRSVAQAPRGVKLRKSARSWASGRCACPNLRHLPTRVARATRVAVGRCIDPPSAHGAVIWQHSTPPSPRIDRFHDEPRFSCHPGGQSTEIRART